MCGAEIQGPLAKLFSHPFPQRKSICLRLGWRKFWLTGILSLSPLSFAIFFLLCNVLLSLTLEDPRSPRPHPSRHPAESHSIPIRTETSHRTCKPPTGFCSAHPIDAKQAGNGRGNPGYLSRSSRARASSSKDTQPSRFAISGFVTRTCPCLTPCAYQAKLRRHDVFCFFPCRYSACSEDERHRITDPRSTAARRPVRV